jgi:hypothetical protein
MSVQLLVQFLLLLADRSVPILVAPLVHTLNGSAESVFGGLKFDNPVTFLGNSPIVSESKQVKGFRTIVCAATVIGLGRRWTEGNEFRLGLGFDLLRYDPTVDPVENLNRSAQNVAGVDDGLFGMVAAADRTVVIARTTLMAPTRVPPWGLICCVTILIRVLVRQVFLVSWK